MASEHEVITLVAASEAGDVEPPGGADGVVDGTVGRVAAPLFAAASAVRRRGIVHPTGRQHQATLAVAGPGTLRGTVLGRRATHPAVVRFSRSAGVPEPAPDAFGIAIRVLSIGASATNGSEPSGPSGYQDLPMLTSAPAPGARNVILPARGFGAGFYSSIVPFRAGGRLVLVGARARFRGQRRPLARYDDLQSALAGGEVTFEVVTASLRGPWRRAAILRVGDALPADEEPRLHFSPYHADGGIEPVGPLNALRRRAYLGSQSARVG